MNSTSITLENISLNIPVYLPGQQRLFQRPSIHSSLGGKISGTSRKAHVTALSDISLAIGPGENLALIGPNGAGKTTLLRVMAGVYPPSSGKMSVNGDLYNLIELGAGIDPEMTGYEGIRFHLLLNEGHIDNLLEVTKDIEEFTELGDYLYFPIRTYSSGMKARLTAALATSRHCDILLIDEGIGAGDASFQEKFQVRLKHFMGGAGIIVIASHSDGLLREYCQKGLVLDHGSSMFYGGLEEALETYHAIAASK